MYEEALSSAVSSVYGLPAVATVHLPQLLPVFQEMLVCQPIWAYLKKQGFIVFPTFDYLF